MNTEYMEISINGSIYPRSFDVNDNHLTLSFFEDNDTISEGWLRQ